MDLIKCLSQTLYNNMNHKGMSITLSSELTEDINLSYIDVDEEIQNGNIETCINAGYLNEYLFLHTFLKMLDNKEINVSISDNATDKNVKYLEKLSKSLEKK
jgi:hypothetical protein